MNEVFAPLKSTHNPSVHSALEGLVTAGMLAPSGDNRQPWRFTVDCERSRIVLHLDESRDRSPMNAGQRMARIAVGAALENMVQTGEFNGWEIRHEIGASSSLITLHTDGKEAVSAAISEVVKNRVTNRRLYDGRALPEDLHKRIKHATPKFQGVRTIWISEQERMRQLADVIGRADAMMFAEPPLRNAFLDNVRFDQSAEAETGEGLSVASLEISRLDRFALRLLPRLPNRLLRLARIGRVFGRQAVRLVQSASGLCVIVAPNDSEQTDLNVGRVMQRAWLALTAERLAAQPMMSLPVLENIMQNGSVSLQRSIGMEKVAALSTEAQRIVPEMDGDRAAFLMRFGFARPPLARTGRLPSSMVVSKPIHQVSNGPSEAETLQ